MSSEIEEIRKLFLNHLNQVDFNPDDVRRIKSCDWIINRFLEHEKILHKDKADVNVTAKKLIQAMKWRNEQKVNQLKESDFPMEYFKCGGLFLCKFNEIVIKFHVKIFRW